MQTESPIRIRAAMLAMASGACLLSLAWAAWAEPPPTVPSAQPPVLENRGTSRPPGPQPDAGRSPSDEPDAASPPSDQGDADASPTPPSVADAGPAADAGSPEPSREAEEAEIAAELQQIQASKSAAANGAAPAAAASAPEGRGASASSRGLSNVMNPALSAAGVALAGATTRKDGDGSTPGDLRTGIFVQEVELHASAIVDPFFKADVSLAGSADRIAFEEAYLSTLEIPHVTFRVGQMKAAVGRHNILHTHAFPFITAPLPWRALMGQEGLADPGISADVLLPLPFYSELNAQVFQGDWPIFEGGIADDPATLVDESVPDRRHDRDLAYVGHLKTLFDLGESATVELGGSYVGGRNGFSGPSSVVAGDLTVKWKPIDAERYTGFDWTTEYAWVDREKAPTDRKQGGGYSALRYQFAQQWWLQARGALLGLPQSDSGRTVRGEALGAFIPSEFSALRLQYAIERRLGSHAAPVHEVFGQVVFSIGPHPAHAY